MAAREYLPGQPPPKDVKAVRSFLRSQGVKPKHELWRLTWTWANAIRNSYMHPRWPIPTDIANLYFALMLSEWRNTFRLKLPPRAADRCPAAVRAVLGTDNPAEAFVIQQYPPEPYLGPCPEERPLAELMAEFDEKAEAKKKPAAVAQARPGELRQNTLLDAVFGDE